MSLEPTTLWGRLLEDEEPSTEERRPPSEVLYESLEHARDALDRDHTGLSKALGRVLDLIQSYSWIRDGRGSYSWDEDEYYEEVGRAFDAISSVAHKALVHSGTEATFAHREIAKALHYAKRYRP